MNQQELKKLLHYDQESGVFTWRVSPCPAVAVGDVAGSIHHSGYRYIRVHRTGYAAHRLAWLYVHGKFPPEEIDFLDHDRDNCAISNLRCASKAENALNLSLAKNNTSGRVGVNYHTRKRLWRAEIRCGKLYRHLGYFELIADAARARADAEVRLGFHSNHGKRS